jgi:hypothetical protein
VIQEGNRCDRCGPGEEREDHPPWQIEPDVYTRKCPESFVRDWGWAFRLWKTTRKHGLPFPGGWAEQPAWVMDILTALDDEFDKWESEKNAGK